MADTSHELRTPIAILRAQVEAFQDGIQEVTPKTLQVLHTEIMGLPSVPIMTETTSAGKFSVVNRLKA